MLITASELFAAINQMPAGNILAFHEDVNIQDGEIAFLFYIVHPTDNLLNVLFDFQPTIPYKKLSDY